MLADAKSVRTRIDKDEGRTALMFACQQRRVELTCLNKDATEIKANPLDVLNFHAGGVAAHLCHASEAMDVDWMASQQSLTGPHPPTSRGRELFVLANQVCAEGRLTPRPIHVVARCSAA